MKGICSSFGECGNVTQLGCLLREVRHGYLLSRVVVWIFDDDN